MSSSASGISGPFSSTAKYWGGAPSLGTARGRGAGAAARGVGVCASRAAGGRGLLLTRVAKAVAARRDLALIIEEGRGGGEARLQQGVEERGGGEVAAGREARDNERRRFETELRRVRVLAQRAVDGAHLLDLRRGWRRARGWVLAWMAKLNSAHHACVRRRSTCVGNGACGANS